MRDRPVALRALLADPDTREIEIAVWLSEHREAIADLIELAEQIDNMDYPQAWGQKLRRVLARLP